MAKSNSASHDEDRIDNNSGDFDIVKFGSKVKVKMSDLSEKIFTILTSRESNPSQGIISDESPIGQALLGHHKGDMVSYQVNGNALRITILDILR